MAVLRGIMLFIPAFLGDRAELAAENLALRQQLAALKEHRKRPRLRKRDRIYWVWLSRLWSGWCSALLIVQADTVVAWHRDGVYGSAFQERVKNMGLEEVLIAPRSPWQNAHAERFVRTIKESCLDRMIFFGEDSLRRALNEFVEFYHPERNHQGLGNRLIDPRNQVGAVDGSVVCRERLGGLPRYYYRAAA